MEYLRITILLFAMPLTLVTKASAQTFSQKCTSQPGLIKCVDFDDTSKIFYTWDSYDAICNAAMTAKGYTRYSLGPDRSGLGNTAATSYGGACHYPEIDSNVKASGAGSLRFTIPSMSEANSSGFFSEVFGKDAQGKFLFVGPGSKLGSVVYFQFKQKMDNNFVNTDFKCLNGSCGGWKQTILYGNPPIGSSSSTIEVTMNNGWQRGVPQMYGQQGHDDYGIEDIIGCTYAKASAGGSGSGFESRPFYLAPYNPTCLHFSIDQWMEFTVRVEILGTPNAPASRVQLWLNGQIAVDYKKAQINWGSSDGDGIGQFMLTPYHTNKDVTHVHNTAYTWYDDVIIATQPIPMSNGALPPPPLAAPAAPKNLQVQ